MDLRAAPPAPIPTSPAVLFAELVRAIGIVGRRIGGPTVAFRSPPADPLVARSLKRLERGYVVAVRVRDRTAAAIAEDCLEGYLAAWGPVAAEAARALLELELRPIIDQHDQRTTP